MPEIAQKRHNTIHLKYSHPAFRLPLLRHYQAICVGRTIWFKGPAAVISQRLLRHELTHQLQIDRYGRVFFYLLYLRDYLKNLVRLGSHSRAYLQIPFEVEARRGEDDELIIKLMAKRLPKPHSYVIR